MPGLTYAVTQTLAPRFYKLKAQTQFEKTKSIVKKALEMTTKSYHAVAELTNKCNIHYHIYAKFESEVYKNFFLDAIRNLGYTDIKFLSTDKDEERWLNYMHKNVLVTERILLTSPKFAKEKPLLQKQLENWVKEINFVINNICQDSESLDEGIRSHQLRLSQLEH